MIYWALYSGASLAYDKRVLCAGNISYLSCSVKSSSRVWPLEGTSSVWALGTTEVGVQLRGQRWLPTKAAAPTVLIRQEGGRWGLKFLFPAVCFHLGWFCLQREQGLNGVYYIFPSNVNCWLRLLLLFCLSTQKSVRALPRHHDGQICICNESVLRQSLYLRLRKLSGRSCSLMLFSLLFC